MRGITQPNSLALIPHSVSRRTGADSNREQEITVPGVFDHSLKLAYMRSPGREVSSFKGHLEMRSAVAASLQRQLQLKWK